jgi:hypothetical protein
VVTLHCIRLASVVGVSVVVLPEVVRREQHLTGLNPLVLLHQILEAATQMGALL